MVVTYTQPVSGRSLNELRRARRILRAERARVVQWRRLVRARLDLAVAAAAQPEALGQDSDVLSAGALVGLPVHTELVEHVLGGGPSIELDRLQALRALDKQLASYEKSVADALDAATTEFIRKVAGDPAEMVRSLETEEGPHAPAPR